MNLVRSIKRKLGRALKTQSRSRRHNAGSSFKLETLEPRLLLSGDSIVGMTEIRQFQDYFNLISLIS